MTRWDTFVGEHPELGEIPWADATLRSTRLLLEAVEESEAELIDRGCYRCPGCSEVGADVQHLVVVGQQDADFTPLHAWCPTFGGTVILLPAAS